MFKLIKLLGKLVVRLYNMEARKLSSKAHLKAKLARELATRANKLSNESIVDIDGAAKVASQAQQLSKFFE